MPMKQGYGVKKDSARVVKKMEPKAPKSKASPTKKSTKKK